MRKFLGIIDEVARRRKSFRYAPRALGVSVTCCIILFLASRRDESVSKSVTNGIRKCKGTKGKEADSAKRHHGC